MVANILFRPKENFTIGKARMILEA